MLVRSLLALVALALPLSFSFANGVERGSVKEAIQKSDEQMQDDLLDFVSDAIVNRCSLDNAKIVNVTVARTEIEIDQGMVDYVYKIKIILAIADQLENEIVELEVGQYAISNPAIPNKEILSISSRVCQ